MQTQRAEYGGYPTPKHKISNFEERSVRVVS